MKKIALILVILIIASGAVWAQADMWKQFNSVQTVSTESRHTAGRWTSDVDNFIDPSLYNPEIGTFAFVGGYPGGMGAGTTTLLTPNANGNAISFGVGKTLGKNYLAAYYGGSLVDAAGGAKVQGANPNKDTTNSNVTWNNNLAVLFGTAGMGFRFDLIANNSSSRNTIDGGTSYRNTTGPTVALRWGSQTMGNIMPWLTIGFKFPDQKIFTAQDPTKKPDKKITVNQNAILNLEADSRYTVNDTVTLLGKLTFNGFFGKSYAGDTNNATILNNLAINLAADGDASQLVANNSKPWTEGGAWNIDLYAHLQKVLKFGEYTSIKVRPYMTVDFASVSNDTTVNNNKTKYPYDNTFNLGTGLDVAGQYQFQKIALYTALGLKFFNWTVDGHSGGKTEDKSSDWTFTGITWNPDRFTAAGLLGFGLTFTPIDNLILGTGIQFAGIGFNPQTMQVTTGALSNYTGALNPFTGTFDITISYKF
ncbi:MAG: hypothetical protein FWF29_02590 [Treponema sp.]|nr:hypothetical protein [Treponema sp.]